MGISLLFFGLRVADGHQKTFQMIFTLPSSAEGDLDALPVVNAPAVSQPHKKRKKKPAKRPSVAIQLGMNGQVTVRAIAYAAVQVRCFFVTH